MNNSGQNITNDAPYTELDMTSFRRAYTHTHLPGCDHFSEIKADIAFQEFSRIVKKELRKSCRRVKIAEYRKLHPPKNFLQRVFTPYGFLTGRCDFCGREEIRNARQRITRQEIEIAFDNGFNPLTTRTGQFQIKWYRIMSSGESELRIQRRDLPWPFSAAATESSGLNFLMVAMFAVSDTALHSHFVPWNDVGRPSFPDVAKKNLVGRDVVGCFDCNEMVRRAIPSGVPPPFTPIGNQDVTPGAPQ